jgi:FixJ family two-component response regulator
MNQKKIKVAVVDDDESFACALERLFRASGFEVCTYPSAEAYLAPTARSQPDCLVLDIHLGGMSGLDLQQRLQEAHSRVPIIFVTAQDAPGVRQKTQQSGCAGYFLKPVPGKSLLEAITKAVNLAGSKGQDKGEN